ncbi:MAG: NFACT family protein, partial [Acetanaerobacterium sp.]
SKDELILVLRQRGGSKKLLISAGAVGARIHFTQNAPENPQAPPMFCMLLRKHLGGARLCAVRQHGLDRVLFLDFETTNELGDPVTLTLCVEIMGRHSNIIFLDGGGRIIDSVKRIGVETSSVRQILPGMTYALPPASHRLSLAADAPQEIVQAVKDAPDGELPKALMTVLEGVSPILAREIAAFAAKGEPLSKGELLPEHYERLAFFIKSIGDILRAASGTPTVVLDETGKPMDFSFLDINQYAGVLQTVHYDTFSQLLDVFYSERGRIERMRQRCHDLIKLLTNASERTARRLAAQREELRTSKGRGELKIKGDLLSANIYRLQKGDTTARVENFYDEALPEVEIILDPALTPQQNVQRCYQEYRKAATAENKLKEQIESGEQEFAYIDSVLDALSRSAGEQELAEIREELAVQGYIRRRAKKGKVAKHKLQGPYHYRSTDGFLILVGRNNVANDRLTLRDAKKQDVWFHTHVIPGSHTVLVTDGKAPTDQAMEQAAMIAAYHSKARESAQVPVDYTEIKNVKKPQGAKPGFVVYDPYKSIFVSPAADKVAALEER